MVGYKMMTFDAKLLSTNVTFEKPIEITLERIYESIEINTLKSKKEMKQLLTLCKKICILLTIIQFTDKTIELLRGHHWDQSCLKYLWSNVRIVWY